MSPSYYPISSCDLFFARLGFHQQHELGLQSGALFEVLRFANLALVMLNIQIRDLFH